MGETMREEQWFASAIDACAEPIIITDAELDFPGPKIVYVNKAFELVTGYTIDELVGKTPRILQGEKTDFDVLKRLRQNLQAGEEFSGRTTNYRKDRSEYVVEWHISVIKNERGEADRYIAVQRDVTDDASEIERLTVQAEKLRVELERRKILEKAKGHLMESRGITENAAHKFLENTSKANKIPMLDLARSVLALR